MRIISLSIENCRHPAADVIKGMKGVMGDRDVMDVRGVKGIKGIERG